MDEKLKFIPNDLLPSDPIRVQKWQCPSCHKYALCVMLPELKGMESVRCPSCKINTDKIFDKIMTLEEYKREQ